MKKIKLGTAILAITLVTTLCVLSSSVLFASTTELSSSVWSGNGHTYHLLANDQTGSLSGLTWADAESYAVNTLGGHLATVDSLALSDWLWSIFGNDAKINLWIGLTDQIVEGDFRWIATGQSPQFTNWYPGEPNNFIDEDYVFILKSGFDGGNGPGPGLWNDGQGTWTGFFDAPIYAIAETSTVPEPATMLLLGFGLAGLVGVRRFKK